MTIFLLALGGLAVWGVVASIVVVARDGYRRQPDRPLAKSWRNATALPDTRPSDLAASQWLREPSARAGRTIRTGPAAGVMVLRPW
jgi:hypothetical protein